MSDADRQRLDRDEVIVRALQSSDGQVSLFAATRLNASPDALARWARNFADRTQSRYVLAAGRFSDPPTAADLDSLELDEHDLQSIRECAVDDCGLKLSAPEIESLQRAVSGAGAGWREVAQRTFRRLMVARVDAYRAGGLSALAAIADRDEPSQLATAFASMVEKSPYLMRSPMLSNWLRSYPRADDARIESFFYWSKEYYGSGKPVIRVTHLGVLRSELDGDVPVVLVASKQIFATHYLEGALGLTVVLRHPESGARYLAHVNRSQLDLLRGFFGGWTRSVLERRLKRHAADVIRGLRLRLERGPASEATEPPS